MKSPALLRRKASRQLKKFASFGQNHFRGHKHVTFVLPGNLLGKVVERVFLVQ